MDSEKCIACGRVIPEGRQVCPICNSGQETDISLVKVAARVIKAYCNHRSDNPQTDCIECPIADICGAEPYTWEI